MMIKKITALTLCLILLFSLSVDSNAKTISVVSDQQTVTKVLTEDEFVKAISKRTGKTQAEVREQININKKATLNKVGILASTYSGSTRYCQAITTKNFASGTNTYLPVELGMFYIEYSYNSFRQINSVEDCWTGASGSGAYTWSEYSLVWTNTGFPRTNAEAHGRGAVEIKIDTSVSGSADLKSSLLGAGFSVSVQVGTSLYLRKVDNIDLYVNIY